MDVIRYIREPQPVLAGKLRTYPAHQWRIMKGQNAVGLFNRHDSPRHLVGAHQELSVTAEPNQEALPAPETPQGNAMHVNAVASLIRQRLARTF